MTKERKIKDFDALDNISNINKTEKKLLTIINSWNESNLICFESNKSFASLLDKDERTIIRTINSLIKKGYIVSENLLQKNGKLKRCISIVYNNLSTINLTGDTSTIITNKFKINETMTENKINSTDNYDLRIKSLEDEIKNVNKRLEDAKKIFSTIKKGVKEFGLTIDKDGNVSKLILSDSKALNNETDKINIEVNKVSEIEEKVVKIENYSNIITTNLNTQNELGFLKGRIKDYDVNKRIIMCNSATGIMFREKFNKILVVFSNNKLNIDNIPLHKVFNNENYFIVNIETLTEETGMYLTTKYGEIKTPIEIEKPIENNNEIEESLLEPSFSYESSIEYKNPFNKKIIGVSK